jgi:hypothetical protein
VFSLDSNRALAPPHDQPSPRSYLNFGLSGTLRRSAAFSDLGRLVLERQPSGFGQRPVNHRGPGKALTVSCRRRCRRSRRRHRRLRRLRPPSPHHRRHCRAIFAAHAAAATASSQPPLPARPPPMPPMPPLLAACASPRCREPACPRACPRELARALCTALHRTGLCEPHVRACTRAALPQAPAARALCVLKPPMCDDCSDDVFMCVCTCALPASALADAVYGVV